jgi:hypothetical protein
LLFSHFTQLSLRLVGLALKLGISLVKGWNILHKLLARLVRGVELLLKAARVADGEKFFFLRLHSNFRVFALSAKNVFVNEPKY